LGYSCNLIDLKLDGEEDEPPDLNNFHIDASSSSSSLRNVETDSVSSGEECVDQCRECARNERKTGSDMDLNGQKNQEESKNLSISEDVSKHSEVALSSEIPQELPKIDIYYSSHSLIRLRPCENKEKGLGLFATGKISKGEVVWKHMPDKYGRVTGKIYTKAEINEQWGNDLDWFWHWAYRCGEDAFLGPLTKEDPDHEATYFQNHSCDPSTWWVDEITLIARRDILAGDEITYDYGTSESDETELGLDGCLCGSSICRGSIRGDDHLRPDLIEKYGKYMQPYLRERVRKHMEERTGKPWSFDCPKRDE